MDDTKVICGSKMICSCGYIGMSEWDFDWDRFVCPRCGDCA